MRIPVGILGVTGLVGRRILARLAHHPWFEVIEAGASDRSAGRAVADILALGRRERAEDGTVVAGDQAGGRAGAGPFLRDGSVRSLSGSWRAPLLISALPGAVARETERRLADEGHLVVSNASAWRTDPAIPLLIPEVNAGHLELLGSSGGIVTNPNCSVATFVPALAPLHRAFGIESAVVTTFQSVSGAGSSGPTVLQMLDNVLPIIEGEEEKLEREPGRLLGSIEGGKVVPARLRVSATTARVPVLHGHLVDLSLRFGRDVGVTEVRELFESVTSPVSLPSLPLHPLQVASESDRPQPRLDRASGEGMTVTVGRLRSCPVNHIRFMALSHNLERGAAGAAVVNAELCRQLGKIPGVAALDGGEQT